jgi:putative addiction module killer protein
MYFIEKTRQFDRWLKRLKDLKAKAKILFRIQRMETDAHLGDCRSVGEGIHEMRIDFGQGYRIYFKEQDGRIILLLCGGSKSTQQKDILKAKEIWRNLKNSK